MRFTTPATALALIATVGLAGHAQSFGAKAPPRLTVAAEPVAKAVGLGDRFDVSLRIVPNPGIHVYAPGNPDNIPVSVSVTPVSWLAADAPKFPKAEDFFFGPLSETLKVYTKPFVVAVPVRVSGAPPPGAAHEVVVGGTVRYQACDDRVCFPPQSTAFEARVPLRTGQR